MMAGGVLLATVAAVAAGQKGIMNVTIPNNYLDRVFEAYYAACPASDDDSASCCDNSTLKKYICTRAGDSCPKTFSDTPSSLLQCTHKTTMMGVDPMVCMGGVYIDHAGRIEACPAGFFCPLTVECKVGCLPGGLCGGPPKLVSVNTTNSTANDTAPCDIKGDICTCGEGGPPPTVYNFFDNATKKRSGVGFVCPGNPDEAPCPGGSFCPNTTTVGGCPAGAYCPIGSQIPTKCNVFSACPAGSTTDAANLQGLVWISILSLVIIVVVWSFEYWRRRVDENPAPNVNRTRQERRRMSHSRQRSFDDMAAISARGHDSPALGRSPHRPGNHHRRMLRPGMMGHPRAVSAPLREFSSGEAAPLLEKDMMGDKTVSIPETVRSVEFELRGVSVSLKKGEKSRILSNISGSIFPENVTVVMGPSGAGKSTLLNVLLGKTQDYVVQGSILANQVEQSTGSFRREVGFVPQDDIMHAELTVRETLMFQALLRLPPDWSNRRVIQLVNSTLSLLELDNVQDSLIGDARKRGISGGQRKRVNIGMELVCDPALLVLDEPTSGLDSTAGLRVVHALQNAATIKGLTIVCVLHQPRYEIFRCCDRLFLLAANGALVYEGHTRYAIRYFEKLGFKLPHLMNPADFLLDIVSGVATLPAEAAAADRNLHDVWIEQAGSRSRMHTQPLFSLNGDSGHEPVQHKIRQRKTRSVLAQLWVFLAREFVLLLRLRKVVFFDLFLVFVGALFLAGSHMNDITIEAYTQLGTLSAIILGVTTLTFSVRVFSQWQTVYWREAARGVNRLSYFVAANLAQVPVFVFAVTIYYTTLYTLLTPRALYSTVFSVQVCYVFACCGLGYLTSNLFNPKTSTMAGIVVVLISAMLCGVNPTLKDAAATVIAPYFIEVSMARFYVWSWWQTEANSTPLIQWITVSNLQSHYGFPLSPSFVAPSCAMLVGYGLLCRAAAFAFMLCLNRGKQR
mmetsp:Transcript_9620/g.29125  ORF Transcript_9620/g.29125 Transcript_9620/m.29125 type:complete len:963 (-) Transcript_9620:351-3239(-)